VLFVVIHVLLLLADKIGLATGVFIAYGYLCL
jgi:hypothetical protein